MGSEGTMKVRVYHTSLMFGARVGVHCCGAFLGTIGC